MVQGEIWWASLDAPAGSEPAYRRPVLIVQSDAFTRSRMRTVVCAAISSDLSLAEAPGNVLLPRAESNIPRDSVVNVSQVITVDKSYLSELVGSVSGRFLARVDAGLRLVLDLA